MSLLLLLLLLPLLLLLLLPPSASAFNSGPCDNEPRCRCKWQAGKKTADCSKGNFQVGRREHVFPECLDGWKKRSYLVLRTFFRFFSFFLFLSLLISIVVRYIWLISHFLRPTWVWGWKEGRGFPLSPRCTFFFFFGGNALSLFLRFPPSRLPLWFSPISLSLPPPPPLSSSSSSSSFLPIWSRRRHLFL